jgi:hypothetical protein
MRDRVRSVKHRKLRAEMSERFQISPERRTLWYNDVLSLSLTN